MSDRDLNQEYVSDDGDVRTKKQLLRALRYEPSIVELTEDGIIVSGTKYSPK